MNVKTMFVMYLMSVAALLYVGVDNAALMLAGLISDPTVDKVVLAEVGIWIGIVIGAVTILIGYLIDRKYGKGTFRLG